MAMLPRRAFLAGSAAVAFAPLLPAFSASPTDVELHGLSAFGDLKYGPGFSHFDYANPDAPTGGLFNFAPPNWLYNQNTQTFNTLNSFVRRSDAPPRMELCFDSLMVRSLDEPDAVYGLLARSLTISPDRNAFEFRLRPEARWHDGSPLTAGDVAFSLTLFKDQGHPTLQLTLRDLSEAVALDPERVRLTFSGEQSARTVLDIVQFPIVSKTYYEANEFDASSLSSPLGSGQYKVGYVAAGQTIEYERVPDYWGRDLPVRRGLHHFDRLRIEFYRERQAAFEAFKKGEILYRQEFTSQVWATGYDFPAIRSGAVVRREFDGEKRPSMQATAINQRRERFRDPRVRRALALCFDFEWTKRNLFYGSYERSQSCFERSDYRADGRPSAAELALLEPHRGDIPEEAFGEAVIQPVSDGSGRDRRLLGQASRLLAEAGWKRQGGVVANDKGERLAVEILVQDESFVRVDTPWLENMRAIGIDATIRMVDEAQYTSRKSSFDFDLLSMALSLSATPTVDEIGELFHSRAAAAPGSNNLPGTSSPAVDALVEAVGKAEDRETLATAMRALDRVLRARLDWMPNWHSANHRAAYWDRFGFKEPKPDYGFPVETLWWEDRDKAAALDRG